MDKIREETKEFETTQLIQTFVKKSVSLETMLKALFWNIKRESLIQSLMDFLSFFLTNNNLDLPPKEVSPSWKTWKERLEKTKIKKADEAMIFIYFGEVAGQLLICHKNKKQKNGQPRGCELLGFDNILGIENISLFLNDDVLQWTSSLIPLKDFMDTAIPVYKKYKEEWKRKTEEDSVSKN
ncbi:MAG: hypothetical protein PHG05_01215 [Candidatus Nanoarchaeia archaeon]|nr:hypothetical protein [Candidatus Nanoarchaeia archaeon]